MLAAAGALAPEDYLLHYSDSVVVDLKTIASRGRNLGETLFHMDSQLCGGPGGCQVATDAPARRQACFAPLSALSPRPVLVFERRDDRGRADFYVLDQDGFALEACVPAEGDGPPQVAATGGPEKAFPVPDVFVRLVRALHRRLGPAGRGGYSLVAAERAERAATLAAVCREFLEDHVLVPVESEAVREARVRQAAAEKALGLERERCAALERELARVSGALAKARQQLSQGLGLAPEPDS
jgi:hypothetical protein